MIKPEEILVQHADNHPNEVVESALKILSEWDGWRKGKSPKVGVATALYATYWLKFQKDVTQQELADEFGCSAGALRSTLDDFREIFKEKYD